MILVNSHGSTSLNISQKCFRNSMNSKISLRECLIEKFIAVQTDWSGTRSAVTSDGTTWSSRALCHVGSDFQTHEARAVTVC
jgi:hypothetical protein